MTIAYSKTICKTEMHSCDAQPYIMALTAHPAAAHPPPPVSPAAVLADGDGNAASGIRALPAVARIITDALETKGVSTAGQRVRFSEGVDTEGAGEGGAEVGQGERHGGGGFGNGGHGHRIVVGGGGVVGGII